MSTAATITPREQPVDAPAVLRVTEVHVGVLIGSLISAPLEGAERNRDPRRL